MARKSDRRKVNDRRADSGGKRVAKAVAKPPKGKAAEPPPAPKIKFRGKLLENEPLARYNTWRIGGPARYPALPADADDVVRSLELAQDRGLPRLVLRLRSERLLHDSRFPR